MKHFLQIGKLLSSLIFFILFSINTKAQLFVPAGLTVNLSGSTLVSSGLDVINEGVINLDSGSVYLEGNYSGAGTFNGNKGSVVFNGTGNQNVSFSGGSSLKNMSIQKSGGKVVFTNAIPELSGVLNLITGNADLGNHDLQVQNLSGGSSSSYVQTSGSGYLKRKLSTDANVFFPVGNNSYNPIYIKTKRSGVSNEFYRVRVLDEVYANGSSGTAISRPRVTRTWDVLSADVNRVDSLDLNFGWNTADQSAGFAGPAFSAYTSPYWKQQNGTATASTGVMLYSNYYGKVSKFSIQNSYQSKIALKFYLQGLYLGSGMMQSALQNWEIAGATSTQADSVTIEVHDATDGALVGLPVKTAINTNGSSQMMVPGLAGNYYLGIKHHNSLETWTATPIEITDSVSYDFSNAASKAYGDNQVQVTPGVYALWTGDINGDGVIETSDYLSMENDVLAILFGYHQTDLTGDAVVETADYLLMENNILQIPFAVLPF
jgi:hypothetical protein